MNYVDVAPSDPQRPLWQNIIATIAYPTSFFLAIAAFLELSASGYSKLVSAYVPVILCATVLLPILEHLIPFRRDWRPNKQELLTDVIYTIVIQVLMPPLLALLAVFTLSDIARPFLHSSIWPHDWPILLQGILMVVLVDFMRYWVHRFAHTNPILWRLHAVHHSPDKLYWLNTARFHPLEKTLHFTFDSIPFILLGVNEYVLAFYFVCYAVNGFYQHSNVYLRFGPLNFIFSTAELHRWHHSKKIQEANHNYSNTTIIWDLIFGTYYCPRSHKLARVGIQNDYYPQGFTQQLLAPFIKNLESRDMLLPTWRETIMNRVLTLGFFMIELVNWRPMKKATQQITLEQQRTLHRILTQNKNTPFGIKHGFTEIRSIADYQRLCPIQTFDSLRQYLEAQDGTGKSSTTAENTLFYAKTSGTTGAAKLLPVTPTMLAQIKRQQALAGYFQYRACPHAFRGALLGITGAAEEEISASGKPIGSISGVMYEMLPWPMKRKFIVPAVVFGIDDHLTKYLLILRLALVRKDITYIATANPSTFVLLLELVHTYREELITSIETGKWLSDRPLSAKVIQAVKSKLNPDLVRANELRNLFSAKKKLELQDIWPYIALVATWTGGNCQIPLQNIKTQLPEKTAFMDLGLLASECRITLTVESDTSSSLPVFQDYFFEFVERSQRDNKQAKFFMLDGLQQGKDYYIYVTTTSGLYRYDMNDIVRVNGNMKSTPLLEFLQKGRGVTNITGEKLYEAHVIQAIGETAKQCSITIPFFIGLANRNSGHYDFYIETNDVVLLNHKELSHILDDNLRLQNDEYKQKRASGRLTSAQVFILKSGTASNFREHLVSRGQKEGQFKMLSLVYQDEVDYDFKTQVLSE